MIFLHIIVLYFLVFYFIMINLLSLLIKSLFYLIYYMHIQYDNKILKCEINHFILSFNKIFLKIILITFQTFYL